MVYSCEGILHDYDVFPKMAFYPWDTEVILRSNHAPLENLIKNQTKNTLTQNWALEIFSVTPYITFKHIKGKDNILADILTQLQRPGLYEKCPHEEDDWDQEITISDEGECIKVVADQESFAPLDPNMILSVNNTTSVDAGHCLNKDTIVLDDITYVIDVEHPIKPQMYLMPQHIKRMQLHDQSLGNIIHKLRKDNVCSTTLPNTYFLDDDGVLYQSVKEGVQICKAMVVLEMLQQLVLTMIQNLLNHNETMRLYNYIRQFYL